MALRGLANRSAPGRRPCLPVCSAFAAPGCRSLCLTACIPAHWLYQYWQVLALCIGPIDGYTQGAKQMQAPAGAFGTVAPASTKEELAASCASGNTGAQHDGIPLSGQICLSVRELCLGAMTFGRKSAEDTSIRKLNRFVAAGSKLIDMADAHSRGRSEEIIRAH